MTSVITATPPTDIAARDAAMAADWDARWVAYCASQDAAWDAIWAAYKASRPTDEQMALNLNPEVV